MYQDIRWFCIYMCVFILSPAIKSEETLDQTEETQTSINTEPEKPLTSLVSNKLSVGEENLSPDGILTSIPVNIFKRADEEGLGETNKNTTKKKPKLYSWWMPNMTMTNSGGQSSASSTEAPVAVELSTKIVISDSPTSRPTRKPRPSRPPRTKRPSKTPSTSSISVSSDDNSKDITTKSPTTQATPAEFVSTTRKPYTNQVSSSSTESSGSYIDPYGVKRKFVHVAKKVGKAAVTTLGVVGSVAVGSAVNTVGNQIAPIASIAVSKAGSVALSAATHAGSYAADVAGRALINFAASLKNSTRTERKDEDIPLVKPIEIHPKKDLKEQNKQTDEGKIVTVYVTHAHQGDQPANSALSRKTNHSTVYHKEDRVLMDTNHVQEMDGLASSSNRSKSTSPRTYVEESEEELYERVEQDDEGDEPTIPAGAKKIVNKDDRKMGKNNVCSNKPGILMTTISFLLGTLTINTVVL